MRSRNLKNGFCRFVAWMLVFSCFSTFCESRNYVDAYKHYYDRQQRIAESAKRLGIDPDLIQNPSGQHSLLGRIIAKMSGFYGDQSPTTPEAKVKAWQERADAIKAASLSARLERADQDLNSVRSIVTTTSRHGGIPTPAERALLAAHLKSLKRVSDKDLISTFIGRNKLDPEAESRLKKVSDMLRSHLFSDASLDTMNLFDTARSLASALGSVNRQESTVDPDAEPGVRPIPEQELQMIDLNGESARVRSSSVTVIPSEGTATKIPRTESAVIQSTAASLGNIPSRIFNFVHDEIDFEPYFGIAKSPEGTMLEMAGSDADQAVLLVELLRAAGYEAVFQWGKVDLTAAQAGEITGTDDIVTAASFLNTAGYNAALLLSGGNPVAVRMDHVWVKAKVPYVPNRGARPGTADTWVLLDPAIKHYEEGDGISINGHVSFTYDGYIDALRTRVSPLDAYKGAASAYLKVSGQDCADLLRVTKARSLSPSDFPFLPGTLPVKPYGAVTEAAELPEAFLSRATLSLVDSAGGSVLSRSFAARDIYGRKLALYYDGTGITRIPKLSLDDTVIESGTDSTIGEEQQVNISFTIPNGINRTVASQSRHKATAGEVKVFTITQGLVPESLINQRIRHQAASSGMTALTDQLAVAGLKYHRHLMEDTRWATGLKWQRFTSYPIEGAASQQVKIQYVSGVPVGIAPAEMNIDMPHIVLGLFPADGNAAYKVETFKFIGAQSSYLENALWEEMLSEEGISAIKALTLAKSEGQTVRTVLPSEDLNSILSDPSVTLSQDVKDELLLRHQQGKNVTFHNSPITLNSWHGAGYLLIDPATGAGGYIISGGLAGGSSTGGSTGGADDTTGSEPWLSGSPLDYLLYSLMMMLGGGNSSTGGNTSTIQADPVNLATGNFIEQASDLTQIARGIPVSFSRTYNSRLNRNSTLGYGWSFNYGQSLEISSGQIVYLDEDGTLHTFTETSPGVYASPAGKHLTLTQDASGYLMKTKEGYMTHFLSDGRMDYEEDTNGNKVTLAYNGSNLSSINDAAGRTVLAFTTDASGLITGISNDPSGTGARTISFGYLQNTDGNYDLTTVTDTAGKIWTYAYDSSHNLTSKTDPLNNVNDYYYDGQDRLVEHVDPLGNSESFAYDPGNRTTAVTDKNGNVRGLSFDGKGRATAALDPMGNENTLSWDADNNLTSMVDARGGTTTNTYDTNGNLLTATDPAGTATTYTYDPVLNRPLTIVQQNGSQTLTTTNTYDTSGNLLTTQSPDGGMTTNIYDSDGQLTETRDALNRPTTIVWDSTKGTLISQTSPGGGTTSVQTDDFGRIKSFTDPTGESISITMDNKDRMLTLTDSQSNVTSFGYDAAGRRTTVTTPRGTTTTGYDALGRVVSTVDAQGNTTRSAYDANGNVLSRTDALGNTWTNTYDALGRTMSSKDPAGNVTSYGYCANMGGSGCSSCGSGGGMCVVTDSMGNVTKQDLDTLGRVSKVTDPMGNETIFTYDPLGRKLTQTDAENHTTRYEYDTAGRLTAVVEANNARTEYTYDLAGNKLTQKDANNNTWHYTYNAMNQLETESDPLNHTTTYHYNTAGQLTSKQTPNGLTISYSYTHRRLTGITHDGTTETFAYDTLGRKTGMSNTETNITYAYDNLNRLITQTDSIAGRTITYSYDGNGNRTLMTITSGATTEAVVKYFYDSLGRLARQEDSRTGNYAFNYDALSRRTNLTYPNGVKAYYQYDNASRLIALLNLAADGTTIDGYNYAYNKAGMRTSMTTTGSALGSNAGTHSYSYDPTYKLTDANYPNGRYEHFTYDSVGNRLNLADDKGTTSYTYNEMNELLTETRTDSGQSPIATAYGYDNNGNTISKQKAGNSPTTYQWDALNRLTALTEDTGTSHSFGYDPNGIRAKTTTGPDSQRFLLAGEDIVEDLSGGNIATYYSHGPGIDEPLAQLKASATSPGYLHHDALGSVTAMTTSTGAVSGANVYNAYGTVANDLLPSSLTKVDSRYGYTSRELDSSGLMYYRSRYLQPGNSFISQDTFDNPIGAVRTLNKYVHTADNPINLSDPSGQNPILIFGMTLVFIFFLMLVFMLIGAIIEVKAPSRPAFYNYSKPMLACIGAIKGFSYFLMSMAAAAIIFVLVGFFKMLLVALADAGILLTPTIAAYIWVKGIDSVSFAFLGTQIVITEWALKFVLEDWIDLLIEGEAYISDMAETTCERLGYDRI